MKQMDRLYGRLTPKERFEIAVSAFGRGDMAEIDRLNDSTTYRHVKIQEPAYFDRLQRIVWLALYFMVDARNLQITVLAGFLAMVIQLSGSDTSSDVGDATESDEKCDALAELCEQRIARLKALQAAWVEFCSGLGISASDVDKMIGTPFMGGLGRLDIIQQIVGEVMPDEAYQRECLNNMMRFWKTKLEDRYTRLR